MEARTVDMVQIGSSESETKHSLKAGLSNSGLHQGKQWRDAQPGGWFSWELKVNPDKPQAVRCDYWGLDGGRKFEILVDGVKIAEQELNSSKGEKFFTVEYPIPPGLLKGKQKITIRFERREDGNRRRIRRSRGQR